MSKCRSILDDIVNDNKKVKEVYGTVLCALRTIEAFINNKVELSNSNMAIALSEKREISELPLFELSLIPVKDDAAEEDLVKKIELVNDISDQ